MTIPYARALSGTAAREEIIRILRTFGADSIGFMDDYERGEVLLAFRHRGRSVQMRASAKGWAAMYLKKNPHTGRHKKTPREYEQAALEQGLVAVNSILRDWVKGQVAAIETGILSFEAVFVPFMLTSDGRPVLERVADMLPKAIESSRQSP